MHRAFNSAPKVFVIDEKDPRSNLHSIECSKQLSSRKNSLPGELRMKMMPIKTNFETMEMVDFKCGVFYEEINHNPVNAVIGN